ncbi:hypothetical protein GCM10010232_07450 [Streptomyces amakusaensis]
MVASCLTQISSSGGFSDTAVKELAVIPRGTGPPVVTTVTPEANSPKARRRALPSVRAGAAAGGAGRAFIRPSR